MRIIISILFVISYAQQITTPDETPINTYGQPLGAQAPTQAMVYGNIDISTEPVGASIIIDGVEKGLTPKTIKKLSAGEHTLLLIYPEYQTISKIFSINAYQTILVNQILAPKTGDIVIYSEPQGATIELRGVYRGETPKTINGIMTGDYSLRLTAKDYKEYKQLITILHNETIKKDIKLIPKPAQITIIGEKKDNVKVEVLGITYNIDGDRIIELPAGKQILKFSRTGYYGYTIDLNLSPNGNESVNIDLRKFQSNNQKNNDKIGFGKNSKLDSSLEIETDIKSIVFPDTIKGKSYLLGVGVSYGLPAQVNYNFRFANNKYNSDGSSLYTYNFEYAVDDYSLSSDSPSESEGAILGEQFTIGIGSPKGSLNYIWGYTEFYGVEAYPLLYSANNNIYEYMGVTLKMYMDYFFWEIGATWGDEEFYQEEIQFYFQLGTMLNVKF